MTTTRNVGHLETMTSGLYRIYNIYIFIYKRIYICAGCNRLKGKRPTENFASSRTLQLYNNNNNILYVYITSSIVLHCS